MRARSPQVTIPLNCAVTMAWLCISRAKTSRPSSSSGSRCTAKPGLVAANLFAGLCLLHLARPHEAVPLLERARAADTSGVAPLLALGQAYVSIRDFHRANNAYLEATRRDPRSAQAWYGVGITRRSLAEALL